VSSFHFISFHLCFFSSCSYFCLSLFPLSYLFLTSLPTFCLSFFLSFFLSYPLLYFSLSLLGLPLPGDLDGDAGIGGLRKGLGQGIIYSGKPKILTLHDTVLILAVHSLFICNIFRSLFARNSPQFTLHVISSPFLFLT
jgi:hypothetical protein